MSLTLPKKWTDSLKLKDKDSIAAYSQSSGNLILHFSAKNGTSRTRFNIFGLTGERLLRELIAHYLSGADEIVAYSTKISSEQRNEIRNLTNDFIGFEINPEYIRIAEERIKEVSWNLFDSSLAQRPAS